VSAISGPAASHGFNGDFLAILSSREAQADVHLREQFSEFGGNFTPLLFGNGDGFERLNTDRFLLVELAAEQQFHSGSLLRGQISSLMNHIDSCFDYRAIRPNSADGISAIASG
jgi:hypothetical protein